MRLSTEDIAAIRGLIQARFGPGTGIWLFGSRLSDSARGGDVDLYVEPAACPTKTCCSPARRCGATWNDGCASPWTW
jgi:hypothetical protein